MGSIVGFIRKLRSGYSAVVFYEFIGNWWAFDEDANCVGELLGRVVIDKGGYKSVFFRKDEFDKVMREFNNKRVLLLQHK